MKALAPCQEAELRRVFAAQVEAHVIAYELAERNARALTRFRLKLAQDPLYPDAELPVSRELYTRWYARKRALAVRWLWNRRAERAGEALPDWAEDVIRGPLPMFLIKQAG